LAWAHWRVGCADLPARAIGNAQADTIGNVVNPERQVQLALKLMF